METKIVHYILESGNNYTGEFEKLVLDYLENGYMSDNKEYATTVEGISYKVLKRNDVTAFYDAEGTALFDVTNNRLKVEYESIKKQTLEPEIKENVLKSDETLKSIKDRAKKKLETELNNSNNKEFAEPVIKNLLKRINESESLADDICKPNKTWEKCSKYIYDQARKQLKGSSGAVRDDVVYEWAEDYFRKDDKNDEEKKEKAKEKSSSNNQMNKTDKKAETAQQKAEKKSDLQKPKTKAEEKAEKSNQEAKPKKNSKNMEGQIDMFSLLGM